MVPDALLEGADLAAHPDAKLVLRAPGMPELEVPLGAPGALRQLTNVSVWDWSGQAAGAPRSWLRCVRCELLEFYI